MELYHHGVKNQKWGVRHGPPYPIQDKTLHKGQIIRSVSVEKNSQRYKNSGRWLYAYTNSHDQKIYTGPFGIFLSRYKQKVNPGKLNKVYEHTFEVTKDLKMPTSEERIDEFIKMYSADKGQTKKDLKQVQDWMEVYGHPAYEKVNVGNLKTKQQYQKAYKMFNVAMENFTQFKSTQNYANIMSKKWDAMVDDNNQGIYNGAQDPIIIFRANEALKEVGKVRLVSDREIKKNTAEVEKELKKEGKRLLY